MSPIRRTAMMMALIVGLGGVRAAPGSTAYLTSRAQNTSNTFTAGTVALSSNPVSAIFTIGGLYPGQSAAATSVTITNAGSLDSKYSMATTLASGNSTLASTAQLSITQGSCPGTTSLYSGALSFNGTTTALTSNASTMTYTISNSLSAGQTVVVTNAVPTGYNGTFTVASASSTQFTVSSTANPGTGITQGTVSQVAALSLRPSTALAAGTGTETLCFQVSLPSSAASSLQGQSATVTFTFTAAQSPNGVS